MQNMASDEGVVVGQAGGWTKGGGYVSQSQPHRDKPPTKLVWPGASGVPALGRRAVARDAPCDHMEVLDAAVLPRGA